MPNGLGSDPGSSCYAPRDLRAVTSPPSTCFCTGSMGTMAASCPWPVRSEPAGVPVTGGGHLCSHQPRWEPRFASPSGGPARRSGHLSHPLLPLLLGRGHPRFPPACFDLDLSSQILCLWLLLAVSSPLHSCPQLSVALSAVRTVTSGWLAIPSHLSPRPTLSMSAGMTG